jgi:hypothetical protein
VDTQNTTSDQVCSVEPSNSFLERSLEYRLSYLKILRGMHKDLIGHGFGYGYLFYWADIAHFLTDIAYTNIELMEKQCAKN